MNQTFLATPDSRPRTGGLAARAGDGQFSWDLLASRVLSPDQAEVIGAIRWIGRSR